MSDCRSDSEIVALVTKEEYAPFFDECGNTRPLAFATLFWGNGLKCILTFHFALGRIQGALDQFREGLASLGVLRYVESYLQVARPFFVHEESSVTAGW